MNTQINPMHIILALAIIAITFTLWQAHRRPDIQFNALDLLMENGRVSRISVAFMLVLVVTTWVIVDLQIHAKLTEGFFTAYGLMWVGPLVAKVVFNKTEPPAPPELKG